MLDKLVEDVNYVFDEDVIAKIKGDVLYLTDTRVSRHADFETLEDSLQEVFDYVSHKIVMVTGGGGSIGSELCRQVAAHNPERLIIFDIYENEKGGF